MRRADGVDALARGLALGLACGAAAGTVTGNLPVGLGAGLVLGILLCAKRRDARSAGMKVRPATPSVRRTRIARKRVDDR